jgi:Tfp pilus assembly protein PilF
MCTKLPAMKPSLRFRFLLFALTLLALPARADTVWVEVRSPHFSVVTDGGEKRGREVALRFEQMRSVFGTLILRERINIPIPLQVVAFRGTKGFRQFLPLWKGKPIEAAGLFMSGENRNFILLDLSYEGRWETVFHEYTHMLMNANYPATQLWFDEGFAEYYSTIKITNKEVRIGEPPENVGYALRQSRFAPVVDLFRVDQRSSGYNESERKSLFYAQSWLLVHYLIDNQKLEQTGKYFDLLQNRKLPVEDAIRQAFGMAPKQLDRVLEDYYRGNQVRVTISEAPPGLDSGAYQVSPLDSTDAKAVLADVHLHSSDYQAQAVKEFEEVLALKPDHAGAHRGLGYAYLRKSDFDKAGASFRRAATLSPNDARVLYLSALLGTRATTAATREPDAVWQMKDHLAKAISIDPEFADAHSLLALVHMWTDDVDAAIASIQTAIGLSPRNEHYQFSLAQFYLAGQFWDEAQAIFQRLEQSNDPQLAAMARDLLQKFAAYRASPPAQLVRQVRPPDTSAYESPKWQRKKDATAPAAGAASPADDPAPASTAPDMRKIDFLRGRLLSVECGPGADATVSIASGGRTWKMHVRNREKLILINADQFSCSWSGLEVSVNYRAGGASDGDLATLEIRTHTEEPVPLRQKQ